MKFKHDDTTIDPRDKSLVTYSKESRKFIVESSSLYGAGIQPVNHNFIIGGDKWVIYLWSEKYQMHICYKWNKNVIDVEGELVADIFTPYFGMISTLNETRANQASLGTELHILND